MELTTTSILTLVIGLIIGGAIVFVIYYIINKKRTNKAIKLIDEAKKEADKQKRDALLELKEEIFKFIMLSSIYFNKNIFLWKHKIESHFTIS